MPCDGAIIFRDLVGKLTVLRSSVKNAAGPVSIGSTA
jgi:hypothetical protein